MKNAVEINDSELEMVNGGFELPMIIRAIKTIIRNSNGGTKKPLSGIVEEARELLRNAAQNGVNIK